MKAKKRRQRWLSVLVCMAMLAAMTGTADAWIVSQNRFGEQWASVKLNGVVDANGGFAISADGQNWKHHLSIAEIFMPNPYQNQMNGGYSDPYGAYMCNLPVVSFDPNDLLMNGNMTCAPGTHIPDYFYNLPVTTCFTQENDPNIYAQVVNNVGIEYGLIYVKRDVWSTYAATGIQDPMYGELIHIDSPVSDGIHFLIDLRYLQVAALTNGSLWGGHVMPVLGDSYAPLHVPDNTLPGVWQDQNVDGVCDQNEIQSNIAFGSFMQQYPTTFVLDESQLDVSAIPLNDVIPIPILMWKEGQSAGNQMMFTELHLNCFIGSNRYLPVPIDVGTVVTNTGMPIFGHTGLTGSGPLSLWTYRVTDMDGRNPMLLQLYQDSGFMLEEASRTLFLPHTIDGMSIQALGAGLFGFFGYNPNYFSPSLPLQTIVVPDSVQYLEDSLFRPEDVAIPRLHLPAGVQFDRPFQTGQVSTVCTCTYDAATDAYCQANNITYEVCAGHTPHALTPPAPALTATGGSGTPGSLIPVTVRLENNPGLIALTMQANYDTTALALERVDDLGLFGSGTFTSGGDLTQSPFTVSWSDDLATQDHTADGDLVTFWFRILPAAAAGTTTVTVSDVAGSTCDAALQVHSPQSGDAQITVSAMAGDVNGDGVLDAQDLLWLTWYLIDPSSVPAAATINLDADGNGTVDQNDRALLAQRIVDNFGS
ncbi:MAG: hypothetical protein IJT44_07640 [Clostridia bacterium]|nr:hypothetical protein [Clostridia bacterium]